MIALLILASASNPKLAISARFYYPYPDKRISYERLYTVDWDGKHRRLLSLKHQHCGQVMWVGRNRLIYEVDTRSVPYTTELWTVRANGGRPRLLAKSGSIDKEASFLSSKDGAPIVIVNRSKVMTINADSGKLVPITLKKNSWYNPFERDGTATRVRSLDKANPGSFIVNSDSEATLNTPQGQVSMEMEIYRGVHDPRTNRLWVFDYPTMHMERLHRIRWNKGTIEELFRAGYCLDWHPDRRYVAFTTQRNIGPYGPDKQVWTNELWVGMLETGAQRQLKFPMAWFRDVAVRPAAATTH